MGKGWLYWALWTGIGGSQCIWPFLPKLQKAVAVRLRRILALTVPRGRRFQAWQDRAFQTFLAEMSERISAARTDGPPEVRIELLDASPTW